jgi:hypothetical protein
LWIWGRFNLNWPLIAWILLMWSCCVWAVQNHSRMDNCGLHLAVSVIVCRVCVLTMSLWVLMSLICEVVVFVYAHLSTFLVNLISYFLRCYLQVSLKLVSRDFILLLYLPTYQLIFCIRREWSILIILLEGFRYHVSIVSSSFHEEWSFGSFIDAWHYEILFGLNFVKLCWTMKFVF